MGGRPMSTTTVAPALLGSGWDAALAAEAALAEHLREWVEGSGVHPALAAANVVSLQGPAVLEALAGERLEAMAGHASQYATTPVARLLKPLEPLAEAGGWWCSGLDPLAGWAPMAWGTFKPHPEAARWDHDKGKRRKYEHPLGAPTRSIWLAVPAVVAQLVADRFRLPLPLEVAADVDGSGGAFWRWWAAEPRLPLCVGEGPKKAGCMLSQGLPTVALVGIDSGAKRTGPRDEAGRRTGPLRLLADLVGEEGAEGPCCALWLRGRSVWVVFDHSDKRNPREPIAARRLGRLLAAAGAAEVRTGTVPGPEKGIDDALLAGRTWEEVAEGLKPLGLEPVVPQLRAADLVVPGYIPAAAIPELGLRRLVAMASAMGSGKTTALASYLAPLMAAGMRVVLITHRRSLGAALAAQLGLPWDDEAAPGSDLRQTGIALCVDSLHGLSRLRFKASDWAGSVVVIDEAAQVLHHALTGRTAIADRRPAVLRELQQLLAGAAMALVCDAQLSDPVLQALEAAVGQRAYLISSNHRPAAGRRLVALPSREHFRAVLEQQLRLGRRLWIATTAQKEGSPNSAQNLRALVLELQPDLPVLVVDSQTVADPDHDAHRLAADPDGIASRYPVVITTPAVQAGLSVLVPFDAVLGVAGGDTPPEGVVQAMARVRCGCDRFLYVPERAPGGRLKVGCGALEPDRLVASLDRHTTALMGQLLAAGGYSLSTDTAGPWLRLWAQLGATQNRQALGYRASCMAMLEAEGYRVEEAQALEAEQQAAAAVLTARLKEISSEAQARADAAVLTAEPLSDEEARKLQQRRRLTPAQRAQLARWRIDRAWGLQGAAPTTELVEADREGLGTALRFRWLISTAEGQTAALEHDAALVRRLAPAGVGWGPDLADRSLLPRIDGARKLGLHQWLERAEVGGWFDADDPALVGLQTAATACADLVRQVLGITPGQTATCTLRRLLRLVGAKLEAKRCKGRSHGERDRYRYRVILLTPPAGIDAAALPAAWAQGLRRP